MDAAKAYTKNLCNLTEFLTLVKDFDFPGFKSTVESLQATNTQAIIQSDIASLKTDTNEIKAMMTEIFYDIRGQTFSSSLGSVPKPTLALTSIPTTIGGRSPHTATISPFVLSLEPSLKRKVKDKIETLFRPEGEQSDLMTKDNKQDKVTKEGPKVNKLEPIQTIIPQTQYLKIPITPKVDKGKVVATKEYSLPLKLVKASKEVRVDPDAIDQKLDVVLVSEADVKIKGTKDFFKHQDAHIKVLTRAHAEKLKQIAKLRKKRLKQIPGELGLNLSLSLLVQDLSLPRRKRKAMELKPKTYIVGLHYRRELPKGVKFVNNLVIEQPKHGLFFTDAFREETF
ncbi:hypothetical protein Tco_0453409 [Tanacetum coccineum]